MGHPLSTAMRTLPSQTRRCRSTRRWYGTARREPQATEDTRRPLHHRCSRSEEDGQVVLRHHRSGCRDRQSRCEAHPSPRCLLPNSPTGNRDLKAYLDKTLGLSTTVECVKTTDRHTSFHITCRCDNPKVFMTESIWPEGAYVRWWGGEETCQQGACSGRVGQ